MGYWLKQIMYYKSRCALWKQAAKNNRKRFVNATGNFLDAMKLFRETQAESDRRLALLEAGLDNLSFCPICEEYDWCPDGTRTSHDPDCELAKELADE